MTTDDANDRGETPAQGADVTEDDAKASLPPGADTKRQDGPKGDVDRAQPYDEQPTGLRMKDTPPPGESK